VTQTRTRLRGGSALAGALVTLALVLFPSSIPALGASAQGQQHDEDGNEGGRAWAVGLHANFPFLGISVRYWLDDSTGLELNLAPIPDCDYGRVRVEMPPPEGKGPPEPVVEPPRCPNALRLHLSVRGLKRVSDNPRADFYATGGPSVTLTFVEGEPPRLERAMLAVLGEIEIRHWPIERVFPVVDYGFALNLQNLYDFRWIAQGEVCPQPDG